MGGLWFIIVAFNYFTRYVSSPKLFCLVGNFVQGEKVCYKHNFFQGGLENKDTYDPKTWKQRPPMFFGALQLRPSWALASWTGIGFVLNKKETLWFVSSKKLTPCVFQVFNGFHRKQFRSKMKIKPWPNGVTSRRKMKPWVFLRLRLARPWVDLRWLAMTCAHFGRNQICTQVKALVHRLATQVKSTKVEWRPLTYY